MPYVVDVITGYARKTAPLDVSETERESSLTVAALVFSINNSYDHVGIQK